MALIARHLGVTITGCDNDPSGAADLAALGVEVRRGHEPGHVDGARAVVVTAAVPPNHPEMERARTHRAPRHPRGPRNQCRRPCAGACSNATAGAAAFQVVATASISICITCIRAVRGAITTRRTSSHFAAFITALPTWARSW